MEIITSAPHKIILCGEHFVVYGAPALAAPTNNRCKVILNSKKGIPKLVLKSKLGKALYSKGKLIGSEAFKVFVPMINEIIEDELPDTVKIEIIDNEVPKGMGSSSSIGIAIAIALLTYLGKGYDDTDLFHYGQIVDEIAHGGKPSGIDARTISRGKPQKFYKTFNPEQFYFEDIGLELPKGTSIIIADTFKGKRESTGQLIKKFAEAYNIKKSPKELTEKERKKLIENYVPIFDKFAQNLKSDGDPKQLGDAMNANHLLLSSVSTKEIEEVRKIALENGAYGAKLTGAGGKGGAVIILSPADEDKRIINAILKNGYKAFSAEIATQGPLVEVKK